MLGLVRFARPRVLAYTAPMGFRSLKKAPRAAAALPSALSRGVALLKRKVEADEEGTTLDLPRDDARELLVVLATIEAGYLAVAADGEVTEAELSHLCRNVSVMLGGGLSSEELAFVLDEIEASLDGDGLDARLQWMTEALDAAQRRRAFAFACVMSLCDGETADEELDVLGLMGEAFEISEDDANAVFNELADQIDESL